MVGQAVPPVAGVSTFWQSKLTCSCGAGWQPASPSHNAHTFGQIETATIYYRWHPLYGQSLAVARRQRFPYSEIVYFRLDDGCTCTVPAWMCSVGCATFTLGPPLISMAALRQLRDLLSTLPFVL